MKFGANLKKIISLSDPEWGPYWMNCTSKIPFRARTVASLLPSDNLFMTPFICFRMVFTWSDTCCALQYPALLPCCVCCMCSRPSPASSCCCASDHQLKRKIKREIAVQAAADASSSASASSSSSSSSSAPSSSAATVDKLLKSSAEVEFFRVLREELQKVRDSTLPALRNSSPVDLRVFFPTADKRLLRVRRGSAAHPPPPRALRLRHAQGDTPSIAHTALGPSLTHTYSRQNNPTAYDKNTWSRLLTACVKFYRDVLMMENFAIMNYCGFSKILKKHDKVGTAVGSF